MNLVEFAANKTTWAIYFIIIVAFIFLSFKFKFTRDTWKEFFRLYFGIGAFLLGLATGFQGITQIFDSQLNLSYSIESIITLIFIVIYTFLLYKAVKGLFDKEGFEWMGAFWLLFFIGCILNAIFTGGRYLPFVGWLLG